MFHYKLTDYLKTKPGDIYLSQNVSYEDVRLGGGWSVHNQKLDLYNILESQIS